MNQLSSATLNVGLLRLPPPHILGNEEALERWYASLTPQDRGRFKAYLDELVAAQPASVRQQIHRNYVRIHASSVGLGQWAGIITGAISAVTQAGVSIYGGKQQSALQEKLAGKKLATQSQIAAVQAAAQKGIQEAMSAAEQQAAQTAAAAQVASAAQAGQASVIRAQVWAKYAVPAAAGVGLLAVFLLLRKKK